MIEPRLIHARLMSDLQKSLGSVVDIDTTDLPTIEATSSALVDVLAIVLSRTPAGLTEDGSVALASAVGNRLIAKLVQERYNYRALLDLAAIDPGLNQEVAGHA